MATDKDKPYIDNYPPLRDWLRKHEARCNWQVPLGPEDRPNAYIESWQIPGARGDVIVVVRANQNGWNIYTADGGNEVASALADAEARIGLTPKA